MCVSILGGIFWNPCFILMFKISLGLIISKLLQQFARSLGKVNLDAEGRIVFSQTCLFEKQNTERKRELFFTCTKDVLCSNVKIFFFLTVNQ
jgi:hypothetical protein